MFNGTQRSRAIPSRLTRVYRQLASVLGAARPAHYFKAVTAPVRALSAFKYHYRRVPERDFVEFLVRAATGPSAAVEAAYGHLAAHRVLWDRLAANLAAHPSREGVQMGRELPALYILGRVLRPRVVVETGVSSGASSAYLLQALCDNGAGHLYSVDLPPGDLPSGWGAGWIVPAELRQAWSLSLGDTRQRLGPLLEGLGEIDWFLHDSLHTYEHMLWEFRTAWPHLKVGGLFLSHDVGANEAFFDFMAEVGVPWTGYRVLNVLGGFVRAR